MMMVLGGYSAGSDCKAHSICNASCNLSNGHIGKCKAIKLNGSNICACVQ